MIPERHIPEGTDPKVCLDCEFAPACPLIFPQCLEKNNDKLLGRTSN
jgi:hypothetical protein